MFVLRYRVGVHIADVSHFIPFDSNLDKMAADRATSVYLVDQVNCTYYKTWLLFITGGSGGAEFPFFFFLKYYYYYYIFPKSC